MIEVLEKHLKSISPGQPAHMGPHTSLDDAVAQGDLILVRVESVPSDYTKIDDPTDQDRQLVPLDGGPGSHHRLKSFDGVTLYRPKDWGRSATDLRGPCVVFDKPNAVVHESGHEKPHGPVFIDEPMTILCEYQRNLDAEEREIRARD